MKIEFEIEDDRKEWLDQLVKWYQLPHYESLLNVMIMEAYNDMEMAKYARGYKKRTGDNR